MKNKISSFFLLGVLTLTLASCFTSRSKYGCPATAYKQVQSSKI